MSNDKKVWVSLLTFDNVNIYGIGMSIPGIYDYPTARKVGDELIKRRELVNYEYDEKVEELRKKSKELSVYGVTIEKMSQNFQAFPSLPDRLWSKEKKVLPKPSDYLFQIRGGGAVVNEAVAKVLKQFRLGNSTLTPLKIHKVTTGELWLDKTFYFLNLCEHRHFTIYPQSHDKIDYTANLGIYQGELQIKNDLLEIQQNAQNCDLDLWHDPMLASSYFMSDVLHDALVEAKLDKKWDMMTCRLV